MSYSPLQVAAQQRTSDFLKKVKAYKTENKLSNSDLAEECEISYSTVSQILNKKRSPRTETMLQIEMATGIKL